MDQDEDLWWEAVYWCERALKLVKASRDGGELENRLVDLNGISIGGGLNSENPYHPVYNHIRAGRMKLKSARCNSANGYKGLRSSTYHQVQPLLKCIDELGKGQLCAWIFVHNVDDDEWGEKEEEN